MSIASLLDSLYHIIWGAPLMLLIIGVGLYLTIALRGIQFTHLGYALKLAFGKDKEKGARGDISNFQSLMTALAATVGIGNIAGVATALVSGGLGALFWMWVTALLGMATKYAEAILAVKYREIDEKGEMSGGPMYFIDRGLGWRWLAAAFAIFGAFDAMTGGNMIQANSIAVVMERAFSLDPIVTAAAIALATAFTILGGIKSIGHVASFLVPFMGIIYIGGASFILARHIDAIPSALGLMFSHAFTPQAAVGGWLGASVAMAIQVGISRGLMSSEAGLGTASIAAAAAKTNEPGKQALVSMTGCLLATILMCSITGLVLAVTGVLGSSDESGNILNGAALTVHAFNSVIPFGEEVVGFSLILFGFTTIIGWAYYGEKCVEYLFGCKAIPLYRIAFVLAAFFGGLIELDIVWKLADICNGLMALPNLIGLLALSPIVISETKSFLASLEKEALFTTAAPVVNEAEKEASFTFSAGSFNR